MKWTAFLLLMFLVNGLSAQEVGYFKSFSEETKSFARQGEKCLSNKDDSCLSFYHQLIESAQRNNECVLCAETELIKAFYTLTAYDSIIEYGERILKNSPQLKGNTRWEVEMEVFLAVGYSYSVKGNNQLSINYFIEAAERAEQLGDRFQQARIKSNIGLKYSDLRNYEKGISLQQEAINDFFTIEDHRLIPRIAANISSGFIDNGNRDSALVWTWKTIQWAREFGDKASEVAGYYLTASVYERRNPDSAIYYIDKAIDLAANLSNVIYQATAYNIKGNIIMEQGNYPEAKKYYLKSIAIYETLGTPAGLFAPLRTLGFEAYYYKDYPTAAEYLYRYNDFNETVISEDNRKLLHELETKFETEKKEKQIVEQELALSQQSKNLMMAILGGSLLSLILAGFYFYKRIEHSNRVKQLQQEKENAILNSFIQGEERERSRISYELHDNVAAMIGAAKLNLEAIPHLSEEKQQQQFIKVKNILERTHADVRHIAHNLLPAVLEHEGLIKATEQFASELNGTGLIKIQIQNKADENIILSKQIQLMLFRVIQELVNNIVKHAQAQHAFIEFSNNSDGLKIEVSDDGVGFDGDINTKSQGLYSISQRLKSIGGSFKFVKNKSSGMSAVAKVNYE